MLLREPRAAGHLQVHPKGPAKLAVITLGEKIWWLKTPFCELKEDTSLGAKQVLWSKEIRL